MKKLNGWVRLGIVVSVIWALSATFIYVDEIVNHPSFAAEYRLHRYFGWTDDIEATQKAHEKAKAQGEDFSERFLFQKPLFSLTGYLQLAFVPLVVCWLGVYLLVWVVRWVREGFRP
jgi:hypothetical protein